MNDGDALIRVEIKGLALDPTSNVPIMILRDVEGKEFLPIWIGIVEANAIAMELEGVEKTPRPMTHDLMNNLLRGAGVQVERIVIVDLQESTFMAEIVINNQGNESAIDARPSDAVALALRHAAPIYVKASVFDLARDSELTKRVKNEDRLKKWLEDVDPDELGKYTM
jgi:bifunctional DNase/RNase